ncbi:MAG TPA: sugar ABC transporter permease [Candidatus Blautia avistercoris]|uniref:carbohydrate ABC transporter permease n=1 Tax=Blautia sp. An249 TaxID=1965603 RepID=UPI000B3AA6C8|nr:sugar ABC transporter permease [Blautia sp. An249]OUO79657.1 hypothetical protein B5F53_06800 [Blautia sp. An249]HIY19482.1 sugar ABC transporter permease [Candidatus Blautia avistercoris]
MVRERQRNGKLVNKIFPYCMTAPAIILFVLFVIAPFIYGLYTSFFQWDGLSEMKYIGTQNYSFVFQDKNYWSALGNTFKYALVVTVLKNGLGLALALLIVKQVRGKGLFRTSLYMPVTFSYVVIGVLWTWIYNPTFGILNSFLTKVGLGSLIQGWLSDPNVALYSVAWVDIWKWIGFHMVLYLAGLQGVPNELYEAAEIDGAGKFQKFWSITLPQINGILVVNVLLAITGAFVNNYNLINVMTDGGPFGSTEVALTYIVRTAFDYRNVGKANAMSMILFAIVLVIGFLQFRVMTKEDNYE